MNQIACYFIQFSAETFGAITRENITQFQEGVLLSSQDAELLLWQFEKLDASKAFDNNKTRLKVVGDSIRPDLFVDQVGHVMRGDTIIGIYLERNLPRYPRFSIPTNLYSNKPRKLFLPFTPPHSKVIFGPLRLCLKKEPILMSLCQTAKLL